MTSFGSPANDGINGMMAWFEALTASFGDDMDWTSSEGVLRLSR
jgi:hypothetical protein